MIGDNLGTGRRAWLGLVLATKESRVTVTHARSRAWRHALAIITTEGSVVDTALLLPAGFPPAPSLRAKHPPRVLQSVLHVPTCLSHVLQGLHGGRCRIVDRLRHGARRLRGAQGLAELGHEALMGDEVVVKPLRGGGDGTMHRRHGGREGDGGGEQRVEHLPWRYEEQHARDQEGDEARKGHRVDHDGHAELQAIQAVAEHHSVHGLLEVVGALCRGARRAELLRDLPARALHRGEGEARVDHHRRRAEHRGHHARRRHGG
mmetsp:Transcript_14579/g.42799  ORF Transcript_14579/g.42799 Transcript_14579/m.42799 type:complete len:262 (-) Transcript_14579:511-1296(-)